MTETYQNWAADFKKSVGELKEVESADYGKYRLCVQDPTGKPYVLVEVKTSDCAYTPNYSLSLVKTIKIPKPKGLRLSVERRIRLVGYLLEIGVFDLLTQAEWGMIFNVSRGSIWYYKKQNEELL